MKMQIKEMYVAQTAVPKEIDVDGFICVSLEAGRNDYGDVEEQE